MRCVRVPGAALSILFAVALIGCANGLTEAEQRLNAGVHLLEEGRLIEAIVKRKRKSNPSVDEVEDGGRARVIEEGISAMVFSYAERNKFLDGAQGVNYELLRTIKHMTDHLEVRSRSEGDWEKAIMLGFELWREVRRCGQGRLHADLEKGTLELIS